MAKLLQLPGDDATQKRFPPPVNCQLVLLPESVLTTATIVPPLAALESRAFTALIVWLEPAYVKYHVAPLVVERRLMFLNSTALLAVVVLPDANERVVPGVSAVNA